VAGIDVRPRRKLAHVVPEIDAVSLVVIDDPDLAADHLRKPDRGRIADAHPSKSALCQGRCLPAEASIDGLPARDRLYKPVVIGLSYYPASMLCV
jgi:hypothetical protein